MDVKSRIVHEHISEIWLIELVDAVKSMSLTEIWLIELVDAVKSMSLTEIWLIESWLML